VCVAAKQVCVSQVTLSQPWAAKIITRAGIFNKDSVYGNYEYNPQDSIIWVFFSNLWQFFTIYTHQAGSLISMFAVFGVVAYFKHEQKVDMPKLELASLAIPTTLVSFFVAFYNQNSFNKYWTAYTVSMHLKGYFNDLVIDATTYFKGVDDKTLWETVRLINLIHHRYYALLQENVTLGDKNIDEEWQTFPLKQCTMPLSMVPVPEGCTQSLASAEEMDLLQKLPCASQHLVLMRHLMTVFNQAKIQQGGEPLSSWHLNRLEETLHNIREDMGKVATQAAKPMPLQYYWAMIFFSLCIKFAYAYAAALNEVSVSWIPLTIYSFGIVGLLEISRQLAMPFGTDDADLPCKDYWWSAYKTTYEIVTEKEVVLPTPAAQKAAPSHHNHKTSEPDMADDQEGSTQPLLPR